jgi:hypothetical protein
MVFVCPAGILMACGGVATARSCSFAAKRPANRPDDILDRPRRAANRDVHSDFQHGHRLIEPPLAAIDQPERQAHGLYGVLASRRVIDGVGKMPTARHPQDNARNSIRVAAGLHALGRRRQERGSTLAPHVLGRFGSKCVVEIVCPD